MKPFIRGSLTAGLALWLVLTVSTAIAQTPSSPKPFVVFDGLGYSNKPDLSVHGLLPVTLVGPGTFDRDWQKHPDRLPPIEMVQIVAQEAQQKGAPVVLDIEHWPLQGSPDVVQSSLQKYLTVLTWFRNSAPGLPIGYYGVPPIRDYWRATKGSTSQEYQAWKGENDQLRPLSDAVNVLYPSLYTFYPDPIGWRLYAIANIAEARRNSGGKPVYVFLWPQYHESNPTLALNYLPEHYWLLQLQTAKQYADGIVLWGGWKINWDETAPWWKITKAFVSGAAKVPTAPPSSVTVQ